ncbi:hypothetical protein HYW40_00210 [Candidatus Curtissbacteria bacterium]|nr:hypothetical protein [Candidatus Curtissbacteria bacterium]
MADQSKAEKNPPPRQELTPEEQEEFVRIFDANNLRDAYAKVGSQIGEKLLNLRSEDGSLRIPTVNGAFRILRERPWFPDLTLPHQRQAILDAYRLNMLSPSRDSYGNYLKNLEETAREDRLRARLEVWKSQQGPNRR